MRNITLGIKKIYNAQATIEEAQLYLLAKCPSNDQQIRYSAEYSANTLLM